MAIMMGKLYQALRAANVPDKEAIEAAEEVAGFESSIGNLRSDLGRTEQRVLTAMQQLETSTARAMHQMEIRILGIMAAMLGILFALIKLV